VTEEQKRSKVSEEEQKVVTLFVVIQNIQWIPGAWINNILQP